MKPQVKQLISRLNRRELVRICNEKMVCAARDLAEFTKNGINANFIVALAHKCENLEDSLNDHQTFRDRSNAPEASKAETEIKDAVKRICDLGQTIWSNNPTKYSDYIITAPHHNQSGNGHPAHMR